MHATNNRANLGSRATDCKVLKFTQPPHLNDVVTSKWYGTIFQLQSSIVYATFDFFRGRDFLPALLPITTGCVTSPMGLGSDSVPVKVDLFGESTYLADSMQFQLEYILRLTEKGVFYIMPTFRGEDPDERHLNQFFHIEAEIKGNLIHVMDLVDDYLFHLVSHIVDKHSAQLLDLIGSIEHLKIFLQRNSAKRIVFSNAIDELGSDNRDHFVYLEDQIIGLSSSGEKKLLSLHGNGIWLTHLPKLGTPFYQQDANDGIHALCADYLLGIGEVIGCGQRHTTLADTQAAMITREVDPSHYSWYLSMKKEHPMLTSGFGLGLERFLLWVLQHNDIRNIPLISRLKGVQTAP